MNWLPSPPTDNLYKFISIFGLYLFLGLIVFFSWLGYLQFHIELEGKRSQAYFFSIGMESKISARLASIASNHPNENKLDWTPPNASLEQEKKFLEAALENHRRTIENNKDAIDHRAGKELEIMEAGGFYWLMPIYVFFAVSLPFFGFIMWYRKIQKPNEQSQDLDIKIKQATIRKIESEIRKNQRRAR